MPHCLRWEKVLKSLYVTSLLLLAGCVDSDGFDDKSADDAMYREANCVSASVRFNLFDAAKRHREHGLSYGAVRFSLTNKLNDFYSLIPDARKRMDYMPKKFVASYLKKACDTEILVVQFNRAK